MLDLAAGLEALTETISSRPAPTFFQIELRGVHTALLDGIFGRPRSFLLLPRFQQIGTKHQSSPSFLRRFQTSTTGRATRSRSSIEPGARDHLRMFALDAVNPAAWICSHTICLLDQNGASSRSSVSPRLSGSSPGIGPSL